MAEEKKPEADKNAPKKAAAPRRTKAKTSSKPEVKAQTADTAAETTDKTTGVVTGVAPTQPELIKMYDSKLSALPSTGGMGTTLFTIAGCAIMVAAAGFFFASRKRVNK